MHAILTLFLVTCTAVATALQHPKSFIPSPHLRGGNTDVESHEHHQQASLASYQLRGAFLRERELANVFQKKDKVDICHYNADVGRYEKISISPNALGAHIGKHKNDMNVTVADRHEGSQNCECSSGYDGDGVNCKDIDDCATNPCGDLNCTDRGANAYECTYDNPCPLGKTGTDCHDDIDEYMQVGIGLVISGYDEAELRTIIEDIVDAQCEEIKQVVVREINNTAVNVTIECIIESIARSSSSRRRLEENESSGRMLQGVSYDVIYNVITIYYCPFDCSFTSEDAVNEVVSNTTALEALLVENNITGVDVNSANVTVVELPTPGCINDFQNLSNTITYAPNGSESPADIVLCMNSNIAFTETIQLRDKAFNLICPDGSTCTLDGQNATRLFEINDANANIVFSGGIIFTNGKAGVSGEGDGGAILLVGGSVTITDATFKANSAGFVGGAIHVVGGSITIADTTLEENKAINGGAIHVVTPGFLKITRTTFHGNSANAGGGAIRVVQGSVEISDTTFKENSSGSGGAIELSGGNLSVNGANFEGNTAYSGGAIHVFIGSPMTTDTIIVTDSTFQGNTAAYGGAIRVNGGSFASSLAITNTTFGGNAAAPKAANIFIFDPPGLVSFTCSDTTNTFCHNFTCSTCDAVGNYPFGLCAPNNMPVECV